MLGEPCSYGDWSGMRGDLVWQLQQFGKMLIEEGRLIRISTYTDPVPE
jgi:hypothetical protein